MAKRTTKKASASDIDDDPMFDTSEKAKNNAINRELVQYFERIERLEEEKKGLTDDVKDVYAEAKSRGYDTKTMRFVARLRKMKPDALNEFDALVDTYRTNVGL